MSEGSVRDALSLLDRGLLTLKKDKELDLNLAQKIFGYFDKSQLIDIFEIILKGEEKTVIEKYRSIYDQGVDPKAFINDFLELIYYFKNINSLIALIVNCQNNINTLLSIFLDISLILENSSSFNEKFVLSSVSKLIFFK